MKKTITIAVLLGLACATAYADTAAVMGPDSMRQMHRQELIAERKAKGDMPMKTAPAQEGNKEPGFWQKEGERSGMNRWSIGGAGNFVRSLNPVPFFQEQDKKYKERKAAAGK